jgi:tRNA-Thr(GGU) m(6)t(6)A37 methyltransferase TsaA
MLVANHRRRGHAEGERLQASMQRVSLPHLTSRGAITMVRLNEIRAGENAVALPQSVDSGLFFIGRCHTSWTDRLACPRQGRLDGPLCRIEVFEPWIAALDGIRAFERLEILYWLHESRRDLVRQSPRDDGVARGTFSLRTPVRPNPIGTHIVRLIDVNGPTLLVRGLDCIDGTPLIDIKPDRTLFTPLAPRQPGDDQVGDEPDRSRG